MKRKYNSQNRRNKAAQTRETIAEAAKELFARRGYESVTIEEIAVKAGVPVPTVYGLFKSKKGILKEVIERALFGREYEALIQQTKQIRHPLQRLRGVAKIARSVYDSERAGMNLLRGAVVVAPEFGKEKSTRAPFPTGDRFEASDLSSHRFGVDPDSLRRAHDSGRAERPKSRHRRDRRNRVHEVAFVQLRGRSPKLLGFPPGLRLVPHGHPARARNFVLVSGATTQDQFPRDSARSRLVLFQLSVHGDCGLEVFLSGPVNH